MNMIQSRDHEMGTYEINKISLSYFDDKTYIQTNGLMDWLLVTRVKKNKQTVILITIKRKTFLTSKFF